MNKAKALVFGHGDMYERKIETIKQSYQVLAILDNQAKEDQEDARFGIPIIPPERIEEYPDYPVILLSYAQGAMAKQMQDLGVVKERLIYGALMSPRNTFEGMLFDDGAGTLRTEDDKVFYENERLHLSLNAEMNDLRSLLPEIKKTDLFVDTSKMVESLPLAPYDDNYGLHRGIPVDRYYIESFLKTNKSLIHGSVLEIGDRIYTGRFGGEAVTSSEVLHVERDDPDGSMIRGNLETGEGLKPDAYDCFICTQTLPFIYDLKRAAESIMYTLKPGGHALITVGGISQIIVYDKLHYGHFWSFTDMSLERLFKETNGTDSVKIKTYGNVKTATAFLYGLGYDEIDQDQLDEYDPNYQLVVTAVVRKKG